MRSGHTVSKHFHAVLHAVCKLHTVLLARLTLITEDCLDPRWKWFKGYLGALDGTFIDVRLPKHEKGRYRTRKGQVAVNVLSVFNPNLQFIYVLSGWEGSAADSHVLRDAIHRDGGLHVSTVIEKLQHVSYVVPFANSLIQNEIPDDLLELEIPDARDSVAEINVECVSTIENNPIWSAWSDDLASAMYAEWLSRA
ncbi:UNVERIFIED_CONTAM: hypothetical protein Sradi_5820600 [Sesamum radiatum]|uniref:DDE Tnp4 domain-containing protein n=1 Tax=Sesamum radiatum TaxID=300843 RepID=A0AAW2KT95_SESRA